MKRWMTLGVVILCFISGVRAQDKTPTITKKTSGFEKYEGYFTFYWDEDNGKVWLEIDKLNDEFLYVHSLAAGIGSNDIGLDRNQLGGTRIVYFDRVGPKLLLVQPNYSYRAVTENPKEKESVRDAFAHSVLWGFKVTAEEDGKILVDMTHFLLQDAHGIARRLKQGGQGNYAIDDSRSALYKPGTMNFPENTEFESILTFTGNAEGGHIRSVTPSPDAVTVREHHSFIQLPDDNYTPRVFDPRAGYMVTSYQDYSTPIGEPLTKRFIKRHRLRKKNPNDKMSEPVEPIIYYVDAGTPEPIRSALIEGASWWNQAFEAVGYKNAFQVKILPDGAHPMDVRYNMINWVHRSTRGWSYGSAVTDPRTGEIIKGHVLLGSLRVRQDYLLAEGLLAPYNNDQRDKEDPMLDMALARIRQLSAHETGHTLGLTHNFAASVNNRASVMDYPVPKVIIKKDNSLDLSEAYDTGVGEWDKVAIAYGYQDFPEKTNEKQELEGILNKAIQGGLLFISDSDARDPGGAHPAAHLWDNGNDAVAELHHVMKVRELALSQFSEANIRSARPMAELEDVLVPVYLYHRYQVEATVKLVGGMNYAYNLKGDAQDGPKPLPAYQQRAALEAVLNTVSADVLALPDHIIERIPPRPLGYYGSRELFRNHTHPAFDPIGGAETASNITMNLLFNPNRAARLVEFEARDSENLGLSEMMDRVLEVTWKKPRSDGYKGAVQRAVNFVTLYNMMELAANKNASSQVRAMTSLKLAKLAIFLNDQANSGLNIQWESAYKYGAGMIQNFMENPDWINGLTPPLQPPPGSPIGSYEEY